MAEEMKALVSRLAEYLKMSEQQLWCFHKYESQVEGWFKGEMLCFLEQEKLASRLPDFEREKLVHVGDKRMNVDVVLQLDKSGSTPLSWVELKHWHIGTQNNIYFGSDWYFKTANHSSCVKREVEKLLKIPEDGDKFMLVLLTKNPGSGEWNSGVKEFNTKFSPLFVRSLTDPSDYPDFFFLGLLHVPEEGQH
ncbi:MAG: hypothetical protein WBW48_17320 [Anaerolineae bacterium]